MIHIDHSLHKLVRSSRILYYYGIGLDGIVWYGPLMVAVFTMLSLSMCCDHGLEVNMCRMIICYDYHDCEGFL